MVRSDVRGCGVGTEILEAMMAWVCHHPTIAKVTTTVFGTNRRAIALYQQFGFTTEGRRVGEYLMGPGRYWDAVVLAKWLKEA